MDTSNCRYDERGFWIGPVLVPCGFEMVSFDSTFHLHNAHIAAEMQGKDITYWIGKFNDRLYLEETGFTEKDPSDLKSRLYQSLTMIVGDNSPVNGGNNYAKKRI